MNRGSDAAPDQVLQLGMTFNFSFTSMRQKHVP